MTILIFIRSTANGFRVTSGRKKVDASQRDYLPDAIKRVAMKRRGPLRNPALNYWPDDMKLLQISETCWQCEWPGTEAAP